MAHCAANYLSLDATIIRTHTTVGGYVAFPSRTAVTHISSAWTINQYNRLINHFAMISDWSIIKNKRLIIFDYVLCSHGQSFHSKKPYLQWNPCIKVYDYCNTHELLICDHSNFKGDQPYSRHWLVGLSSLIDYNWYLSIENLND